MLTLRQRMALGQLAHALYDLMPKSAFENAAAECGLTSYWQQASKMPAIVALLEGTLDHQPARFERLMEVIIAQAVQRRDGTLTREAMNAINDEILAAGMKLPALREEGFLRALPWSSPQPTSDPNVDVPREDTQERLEKLLNRFVALSQAADRQAAGIELERLLNSLFNIAGLRPRSPFRVVGEQIDGSFDLDRQVYLLEAKWCKDPIAINDLYVFRAKVEGKSEFTRGLFISVNGFSVGALQGLIAGKRPNFVMMDGSHLYRVLCGHVALDELIREQVRLCAETGEAYVPIDRSLDVLPIGRA